MKRGSEFVERSRYADLDAERREIDLMRAKAPRTARLLAEVQDRVHALEAGPQGPQRNRLETFLLVLAKMADAGQDVNDEEEAVVRAELAR